jgi:hypothetical protein
MKRTKGAGERDHGQQATLGSKRVKPRANYAITRCDNAAKRERLWIVRIQRRGKIFNKRFPDLSYGGKQQALRAARAYRDEIARLHPPMSRAEYATKLRRNNRSGIPGVCGVERSTAEGAKARRLFWVAFWPTADHGKAQIKFAVKRYGDEKARELAIEARTRALAQMRDPHLNTRGLKQWVKQHD